MKKIKNIFIFFLILFTFSFSVSNTKSTVYLEKTNEVSNLKIGVTKLNSQNLPLQFDANTKQIYGEIEVDDNDLVYVSETLAEIPSVSTTNGRKSINNIKRYMTKEIKEAPNFKYQVIKDERDKENPKKYLVIDCESELKGVYVYIVEKATYKVKKVYKGSFIQLFSVTASETYGNIAIESGIIDNEYRKITMKNGNLFVSTSGNGNYETEDIEAEKKVKITGKFPERVSYDEIKKVSGRKDPWVVATISSKHDKSVKPLEIKLNRSNDGYSDFQAIATLKDSTGQNSTQININSGDYYNKEKYLSILIRRPRPFDDDEYTVELQYGYYWLGSFYEVINHKFTIDVKGNGEQLLSPDTEGKIIFDKPEPFLSIPSTIIGGSVNGETPNVENQNIKKENYRSTGKFLKKPLKEKLNVNAIEDGIDLHMILNTSSIEGLDKKYEKTITLKGTKLWDGKISEVSFTSDLFDVVGKKIGKIGLYSDNENEDYYKIKITGWDSTFTHQLVNAKITLIYEKVIKRGSKEETRKPIKKDIYNVLINPKQEIIPPDTRGTLIITNPNELAGHDIYITEAKKIGIRTNSEHKNGSGSIPTFKEEQILFSGEIPKKFITNKNSGNWVNWGEKSRLIIRGDNGFGDASTNYNYNDGTFNTTPDNSGKEGWYYIHSNKNKEIGWIYFSSAQRDTDTDTLVIGFAGKGIKGKQIVLKEGENVNHRFEFVYQIQVGNEWIDKKVDVLDLIIQPNLPAPTPTIELKNPLVYYDYNSSSAISNIVHNRRVHLAKNEAITLNNNGSKFIKNTNLSGEDWIIPSPDIRDYPWEDLGKHKISIYRGKNEVIKVTKENGGTNSSTYLSGDKIGNVNRSKNEVMLSYDGGNKYLNFGLSKYNFDGEDINDISITNYTDKALESRATYKVKIPRFEGIHYMGNFDIKPKQNYTKDYAYDSTKPNDKPIVIDYGTVGFRDLDTRITNQSGGEGIDFRVTKKVKLIHLDKNNKETGYVINNAELYFENGVDVSDDTGDGTSRFKGKNEKSTSAMLKLKIPQQETLVKDGKYKILTSDENKVKDVNPLRIGVTVNNNKEKYYTYMGGESFENGNAGNIFTTGTGKNLYLNITTKRFVETIIEFENENLKKENGNINWIKLNKSNFSFGKLTNKITLANGKQSDIWGRVKGEIIDIPVIKNEKSSNLKMTLFDDNNKVLIDNLNTINGEYKFSLALDSNNNHRNFIISRENVNDNYIRFSLDNGYDATKEKDIKFYIRYIDTSNGQNKFLFDQRYIVKFKQTINYKGDINIRFKNPSMTMDINNGSGATSLFTRNYNNNGNHRTTKDKIDWVEVQISDETINNLKTDINNSFCELYDNLNKVLLNDSEIKEFILKQDNDFIIGLPKTKNIFETLFGNYTGNKIEKTLDMKFLNSGTGIIDNGKDKTYRLNITIDEFDPKYYGKVFVGNSDDTETYMEINSVGNSTLDLQLNNLQADNFVYVDLGTSYRDYLRYEALPKALLEKDLFINIKGQVDAIPVGSNYAKPVKGDIVLLDGTNYIDITNKNRIIEFTKDGGPTASHKNYPLKLKLSLAEYKKLKPYTKYEIFLNGNQNVITIGTETLNDNILFNKPLNFITKGPGIKIETSILDFGQIKLENETSPLVIKEGKTEIPIKVIKNGTLDNNLDITSEGLTVNTDTIFIKQRSANNEVMVNGGELKVRDLKTEKLNNTSTEVVEQNTEIIEYYDVLGVLEVPKNLSKEKYGSYSGTVEVTYTFY